ncbi:MAG: hypothetical protein ABS951_03835 [Solibacillus sp.]
MLVTNALPQDVAFLAFVPLPYGAAKEMIFRARSVPVESPALHSNQLVKSKCSFYCTFL